MRRLALIAALLLPATALAAPTPVLIADQPVQVTGTFSSSGASNTIGSTVALNANSVCATVWLAGQPGASLDLASGTLTSTLTPSISGDATQSGNGCTGGTWTPTGFIDPATGNSSATLAANNPNAGALLNVRVGSAVCARVCTAASGTTGTASAFLLATASTAVLAPAADVTDRAGRLLGVVSGSGTFAVSAASLPLPTGAAADATLTGGTQKAIARGGAKGSTGAADVTSTASGVNHQAMDVTLWDQAGSALDPRQIRALTSADVVSAIQSGTWTVTQGGAWSVGLLTGSATIGAVTAPGAAALALDGTLTGGTQRTKITDGTNNAAVKAASTAAVATDPAVVVGLSPNSPFPAGANIVGKFGIDQTTPGTTNGVQVNAALPGGTNTIGAVTGPAAAPLALDASVTGLEVAQGSTTSGQKGVLKLGAVTTGAPTYTTGQSSPVSLQTDGSQRVAITNTPAVTVSSGTVTANVGTTNGLALDATLTGGTAKARITGNAGGVMDAAGQNAASPASELLVGAQFNTTPTTITTGNISPLQMDSAGNLLVNIKAGAAAGGTSSTLNAAMPASGTAVGGSVTASAPTYTAGNLSALSLDTAGNLRVAGSFSAGAAADTAGTLVSLTAACATGSACAAGSTAVVAMAGQNSANVTFSAGASPVMTVVADCSKDGGTTYLVGGSPASIGLVYFETDPGVFSTSIANPGNTSYALVSPESCTHIRVRAGAFTSGSVSAQLRSVTGVPDGTGYTGVPGLALGYPPFAAALMAQDSATATTGRALVATANGLKVDGSATTQPVSGTVTVTQATGTALHAVIDTTSTTAVTQATAANLNAQVQGAAASGATKAGNPVQQGLVFNTTQPTVTTGQAVESQATARGAQIVATGVDAFNVTLAGTGNVQGLGSLGSPSGAPLTVQGGTGMFPFSIKTAGTDNVASNAADHSNASVTLSTACVATTGCAATAAISWLTNGLQSGSFDVTAISVPVGFTLACDQSTDALNYILATCSFRNALTGAQKQTLANADLTASSKWVAFWDGAPQSVQVRVSAVTSGSITVRSNATFGQAFPPQIAHNVALGMPQDANGSAILTPIGGADQTTATTPRQLTFAPASTSALATAPAAVVALSPNPSTVCTTTKPISQTASTDLITSTNKLHICSIVLVSTTAQSFSLVEGTGAVCATGIAAVIGATTAANGIPAAANGGFSAVAERAWLRTVTTADHLCLLQSGAGLIAGVITYTDQP